MCIDFYAYDLHTQLHGNEQYRSCARTYAVDKMRLALWLCVWLRSKPTNSTFRWFMRRSIADINCNILLLYGLLLEPSILSVHTDALVHTFFLFFRFTLLPLIALMQNKTCCESTDDSGDVFFFFFGFTPIRLLLCGNIYKFFFSPILLSVWAVRPLTSRVAADWVALRFRWLGTLPANPNGNSLQYRSGAQVDFFFSLVVRPL